MNSFAHSLSHPLARRESSSVDRHEITNTAVAMLIATIAALLISGALLYNSMDSQIETLQASQVAAQQDAVQSDAFTACLDNHPSSADVTNSCHTAAATFAANDSDPDTFNKAVAYIYPR